MFKKELLLDGKAFSKGKKISAKRPTEYWLDFLKQYVLTYKTPTNYRSYLIFLIPVFCLGVMIFLHIDIDTIMIVMFFSVFITVIISIIMQGLKRQAVVPINAYHELAKFIISIKGDIYKNRFDMRINSGVIEEDTNLLDPVKIGIVRRARTKYKPFELERFKANFTLKDGTFCSVSLNQITMRVTTTKRRSSGKTKTKMKRKHKFFHLLTLKLNEADYKVFTPGTNITNTPDFDIVLHTENGFHFIKIKAKIKLTNVASKLSRSAMHSPSLYTNMIDYLWQHKIIEATNSNKLIH